MPTVISFSLPMKSPWPDPRTAAAAEPDHIICNTIHWSEADHRIAVFLKLESKT